MENLQHSDIIADGYFEVPLDFLGDLRAGDTIRYTMLNRPGKTFGGTIGFVIASAEARSRKFRINSDRPGGGSFIHCVADMDRVYKKYSPGTSIEFQMIAVSLAEKNKIISDLSRRISALEKRII